MSLHRSNSSRLHKFKAVSKKSALLTLGKKPREVFDIISAELKDLEDARMRSMRDRLIFHCQVEQNSGEQNIKKGGQPCQVVPSHMMLLEGVLVAAGVLQFVLGILLRF